MNEHAEMGPDYHELMRRVDRLPQRARQAVQALVQGGRHGKKLSDAILGHLDGRVTLHAFRYAVMEYVEAVSTIVAQAEKEDIAA